MYYSTITPFYSLKEKKKRKRLIALDLTKGFGTSFLTCTAKVKQVMFDVSSSTKVYDELSYFPCSYHCTKKNEFT